MDIKHEIEFWQQMMAALFAVGDMFTDEFNAQLKYCEMKLQNALAAQALSKKDWDKVAEFSSWFD